MLFTGFSEHSIDGKGRLAIPAKYRNRWDAARDGTTWACFPYPSPVPHLRLYTETFFEAASQTGRPTLIPDRDTAELEPRLFSSVEHLDMDSNGRIILPKRHLDRVGISGDVAIVGSGNHLQVHDLARWKATDDAGFHAMPELVERIHSRRIPPS